MTPDEFHATVLRQLVTAWFDRCFCANPGFQKLVAFDFRDYGIAPTGLADSEIVIDTIIRQRFTRQNESDSHQGETRRVYMCPQCEATCTEWYAEFSVNMRQSSVAYDRNPQLAARGFYLVGFYGFDRDDFDRITDYQEASTAEAFMREITAR
jgi:hypothetical protein